MKSAIFGDDFYARLGLTSSATPEEVKRAYRTLVRQYPPERAPEEFKHIREAYETLSSARSRGEYDQRPSEDLQGLISQGMLALDRESHPEAERLFKQVLILAPQLHFVRNFLALSLLYQERNEEALEQFERLLALPELEPPFVVNAAHAYLRARRFSEAERLFRRAIALGGEVPVDACYAALADMYQQMGRPGEACYSLEAAVRTSPTPEGQCLHLVQLLTLRLAAEDLENAQLAIDQIQERAREEGIKREIAIRLGLLAQVMIFQADFASASLSVGGARSLQPADRDYLALEQLIQAFGMEDPRVALDVVRQYPSFRPGGWLEDLGRKVESALRGVLKLD